MTHSPTPEERAPGAADAPQAAAPKERQTKERLLRAGMDAFAERGFADASIRQICTQAGANAAAVNYHFGDKQRFYAEVLATCHMRAWQRRPIPRLAEFDRPSAALGAWIRWFLEILTVDGAGPLGRLLAREMADPTTAVDELVKRSMAPMMATLHEIVGALIPEHDAESRNLCLQSIVGQCLFYRHAQPVFKSIERLSRDGGLPPGTPMVSLVDVDRLADHITQFSLAGLAKAGSADGGSP
ncbi:MAG: CerR family C-terminal domain-containing protein [Acidobacteriota bacterium]